MDKERKGNKNMSDVINVAEIFGEDVFNDTVMQSRLPKKVYKDLKRMIRRVRNWIWLPLMSLRMR